MAFITSKPLHLTSKDLRRVVRLYFVLKKCDVWTKPPKYRYDGTHFLVYNEVIQ